MKKDIVLCGVGGDGIVSVAKIISDAALNMGLNLKQSEIHGMSQRGGSVFSHLRLSSEEIFADVIPEGQADIILSSEPMEALRYLPWLAKDGWIITNNEPFVNIKNYPDMEKVNAELGKIMGSRGRGRGFESQLSHSPAVCSQESYSASPPRKTSRVLLQRVSRP